MWHYLVQRLDATLPLSMMLVNIAATGSTGAVDRPATLAASAWPMDLRNLQFQHQELQPGQAHWQQEQQQPGQQLQQPGQPCWKQGQQQHLPPPPQQGRWQQESAVLGSQEQLGKQHLHDISRPQKTLECLDSSRVLGITSGGILFGAAKMEHLKYQVGQQGTWDSQERGRAGSVMEGVNGVCM